MAGRVLVIAGSDSGGGAGIQADIKTIMGLGGYAMTAITALTAQNTLGVQGIHPVPAEFVLQQIDSVLSDIGADAIKLGMLANEEIAEAVAERLSKETIPIVLDPVMISTSGDALIPPPPDGGGRAPFHQEREGEGQTLYEYPHPPGVAGRPLPSGRGEIFKHLISLSALVTPNIPEAEALTGLTIARLDDCRCAAEKILAMGAKAVLLKGGHGEGTTVTDLYISPDATREFSAPRLDTRHTHGTGCTLASAIAVGLAQKMDIVAAIDRAHRYVYNAIKTAPGLGQGHGPLNHNI